MSDVAAAPFWRGSVEKLEGEEVSEAVGDEDDGLVGALDEAFEVGEVEVADVAGVG